MTKEEQIALDLWREKEARRIANSFAWSDPQSAQHEEYRRLVRDDVRPPVVVDRAEDLFQKAFTQETVAEGVTLIRTYGDERHAEGERAGIERAIEWMADKTMAAKWAVREMRRDLLGEKQQ